ncbi:hypothetical protein BBF96_03135 [Anoxybacter fermentans]|uniref:Major facilitator superfamily (MFS) profile domain-containing protein n=1 Tax=Anoxybacter fermentans TaxID=1323375 RepID=A0A3S9SW16_9FIRM|nr:hypothetical protein [Anoxybacter fermentans]AZR72462.1 hypothetical protein BBF96_03135 [Anoxybacter fermentans]
MGSLVITFLLEIKKFYRLTIIGLTLHGVVLTLIGIAVIPDVMNMILISSSYLIITGLMFIMGIINVMINVPIITLFQRKVHDGIRGRFFAILSTLPRV